MDQPNHNRKLGLCVDGKMDKASMLDHNYDMSALYETCNEDVIEKMAGIRIHTTVKPCKQFSRNLTSKTSGLKLLNPT